MPVATTVIDAIMQFLLHVGQAILVWIVGRPLIRWAVNFVKRWLDSRKVEPTATRFLLLTLSVVLNILLILTLFGVFGIQTAGFAAILAAIGVALGVAISGLLAHFAAGLLMSTLRPFKVGDFVDAGGVTGTVVELGMLHTKIDTPDNVLTLVGNNTIFRGTIQNYSANPYRRVLLPVQLANGADHRHAISVLTELGKKVANVVAAPAPSADIGEFKLTGPVVALEVYCHTDDYWQVLFDGNRMIRETLTGPVFPQPVDALQVINAA
jgi:small conductance mechanosensitive channel